MVKRVAHLADRLLDVLQMHNQAGADGKKWAASKKNSL